MNNNTYTNHFSMPGDEHLPPLPGKGEVGPRVCDVVKMYLGVLDDLTTVQLEIILEHVRICADCAAAQLLMQSATSIVGGLPGSTPSPRVDEAVMASIAVRGKVQPGGSDASVPARSGHARSQVSPLIPTPLPPPREARATLRLPTSTGRRRFGLRWGALASVAMAAVVILSFLATAHFMFGFGAAPQAFTLPAALSWNGYVIYHSETRIDAQGVRYHVSTYYDPGSGSMHVETVMPGSMDVVAVGDGHSILGMDMMHHVAQWEANAWSTDESMFNLAAIRIDMKTSRATFMDKDVFRGQAVYRLRCSNGLVLLLNMRYEPVNVLRGAVGPGTGEPLYDSLVMMPSSHVPADMWDMQVPNGFTMGSLPERP
jgi:hypothetical protein